jgi:hypothetical protein
MMIGLLTVTLLATERVCVGVSFKTAPFIGRLMLSRP